MGYELKMFIGSVHHNQPSFSHKEHVWFQVMGMVEMCNIVCKPTCDKDLQVPVFMFGIDGNGEFIEDQYDDKLLAIPIEKALKYFKESRNKDKYRRNFWAYRVLKGMMCKDRGKHGITPTHVVFFGH